MSYKKVSKDCIKVTTAHLNHDCCLFCRAFLHWASRSADDMIKGYKLNLQQFTGFNKVPNGILNFWFKFQHCRKVFKYHTNWKLMRI